MLFKVGDYIKVKSGKSLALGLSINKVYRVLNLSKTLERMPDSDITAYVVHIIDDSGGDNWYAHTRFKLTKPKSYNRNKFNKLLEDI